ncbi:hypothetical protein ACFL1X_04880, partial [Candidatus Hydrogenedentota bacterium]
FGLNHIGWFQDVRYCGKSVMDRVLETMARRKPNGFDVQLIELFRMVPTGSVSFFFRGDAVVRQQKEKNKYRGEELHELEQAILELYKNESLTDIPDLVRERRVSWYENSIVPLLAALTSQRTRELIVCTRNNGCLRGMPNDSIVETTATVSSDGIGICKRVGESPAFLKGIFYSVKASERLTLEAIENQSYNKALRALAIHPLVPSLGLAHAYLDRIIEEENFVLR